MHVMYQLLVIPTYEHNVYIALYMTIILMFDKWLKTVLIGSMFDKWYENVYKIHTHNITDEKEMLLVCKIS